MTYLEFVDWMDLNTPSGEDSEVLVEFLASLAAELINVGAEKNGITPKEFLIGFLDSKFERFARH